MIPGRSDGSLGMAGYRAVGVAALLFAALSAPSFGVQTTALPNFAPTNAIGWIAQGAEFLPPASGPGPVMSDPAHPRISNAVAVATGVQPTFHIGDINSPILQPWAREEMRKRNEQILAGKP